MTSPANYLDVQQILAAEHAIAEAAEAHGTLTGCLCATGGYRFEDWLQEILPEGEAQPQADASLRELFEATAGALSSQEMAFQPLLPDEADPIAQRAAALGQWCHGFLYGLGSGAIGDAGGLPGNVGEIVRDFTEITRVDVSSADSEESNESAYAELVEFVRVGVQLLFEELEPLRADPPSDTPAAGDSQPLH